MAFIAYPNRDSNIANQEISGKRFTLQKLETRKSAKVMAGKSFTLPDTWKVVADQYVAEYYVPKPESLDDLVLLMQADAKLAKYLMGTAYNLYYHGVVGATLSEITTAKKQQVVLSALAEVLGGKCSLPGSELFRDDVLKSGYTPKSLGEIYDKYMSLEGGWAEYLTEVQAGV